MADNSRMSSIPAYEAALRRVWRVDKVQRLLRVGLGRRPLR